MAMHASPSQEDVIARLQNTCKCNQSQRLIMLCLFDRMQHSFTLSLSHRLPFPAQFTRTAGENYSETVPVRTIGRCHWPGR